MLAWVTASVIGSVELSTGLMEPALVPQEEAESPGDRMPSLRAREGGEVDDWSRGSAELELKEVGGAAEERCGLVLALSPVPPVAPSMPASCSSLPLLATKSLPPTRTRLLHVQFLPNTCGNPSSAAKGSM